MNQESRTKKTFLNARINLIFYFLTLILSFFSRKIFLAILGNDFVGLTSTLQNLLSFLNIAELGIGTAIGYILYKPLFDHNQQKINEIISVFGYMYQWVGKIIFISGFILSLFLPLIFQNTIFELLVIYLAYYSFLLSSLIGYFINYRQTLLSADQKQYVVTAYLQTGSIIKVIIQMISAYYTGNYYLWISIEFIYGIIHSIILNKKIDQTYPWLKSNIQEGKVLLKKYPEVIKFTKQIFIHKIGGVIQFQLTPFLVYAFVSLQTVALYGNYSLVIDKLTLLIRNFLDSTAAGIGNLIAEGNKIKSLKVYWELTSLRIFLISVISFSLYTLLPMFIELWLGNEYVLSNYVLLFVILTFALNIMRGVNDQFLQAHGLFNDVWAPIAESIIYILTAIIGGYLWNLEGLLLGSIISVFSIHYTWKPYYLFSKGFKVPTIVYWKNIFINIVFVFLSYFIFLFINEHFDFLKPIENWMSFILYSAYVGVTITILMFISLYLGTSGMKSFVHRIINR